ncbi:MAG: sigma-70 family RNA polymerase sigma factor [Bacteroidia bacterium]|nr:sigma-70 family RNA polymerase sigma factor [Bacteroidia bacterium]
MNIFSNSYNINKPVNLNKNSSGKLQGNWELNLATKQLHWSDDQFRLYGYEPYEFRLNNEFFIQNTTYEYDIERITKIINKAISGKTFYSFRSRIIKKNGIISLAETQAEIIRSPNGEAQKIIGTTSDISNTTDINYNDPKYFNIIFINYRKALYSEIFRLTKQKDLSYDLCQEVFIKAWQNIPEYNAGKGELYTWLISIARNHCNDYYRSKQFQTVRNTSLIDTNSQFALIPETFNLDHIDIKMLLSKLNIEQKEIIEMLFIQGFSQSEVAKIKNLPLGTVKTKSRSALKLLKEMKR